MKSFSKIIEQIEKKSDQKIDIVNVVSRQLNIPPHIVRKGISQQLLTINGKVVVSKNIYFIEGSIVKFQNQLILVSMPYDDSQDHFSQFIKSICEELKISDTENIRSDLKIPFCCYIIEYLCSYSYESINQNTPYFEVAYSELELLYREYFKDSKEVKVPKRKELTENFIKRRTDKLRDLAVLTENLLAGTFNANLYKFLQDYNKIISQTSFAYCIAPLIPSTIYSKAVIETLIKPITESINQNGIDKKYQHFESNKHLYTNYFGEVDDSNELQNNVFRKNAEYLFSLLKKECQTLDAKHAIISIKPAFRKYNFDNPERVSFDLFFVCENTGEGLGREITIESMSDSFIFPNYKVGILKPNEKINFTIASNVKFDSNFQPIIQLKCSWEDKGADLKSELFELELQIQSNNIPWQELERNKPYTIQEIEDKKKLYGRDEILRELENNIKSSNIESYKIWGQKRVGKSSIVKTLKSLFIDQEKVIVVWRSIAGLKNTDPIETLNTLGEAICVEIFEEIDLKITKPAERERLRSIEVPEFNGSLYPLENYIKKLKRNDNSLKFIIILDEFDRINEEFFLPGNLGDTFSLNIGKGLSGNNAIGFILVGSENMHLLDRQEINYNSFQEREIDTFDKKTEYDSFKNIVTGPVSPYINYSSEAIELIFSSTNGNPYFANLICSNVFKICLKLKDNEVDITTVQSAIEIIVESSQKSHYEHFWGDGITDESSVKKEKKTDIRRRLLVSYSFVFYQLKKYPTKNEIIKSFKKPSEYLVENYEIENTINEFYTRKIFYENADSQIRIKPELFEKWLCGPGRTLMIEGVSDLEALQREKQLEIEHSLKQGEIDRISRNLKFKGQELSKNILIDFFNQFGGPLEQRRIFKIIDSIYYLSKIEIQDFFKKEQKNIFRTSVIEMKLGARTPVRENVEIYSFPSTLNDNEEIIDTFKVLGHIRTTKTIKNIKLGKDIWKQNGADDIIIFDCVIDDFSLISHDLLRFLDDPQVKEKAVVKLLTLIITSKAKADLIKATSTFSNFKIIHFKEVEESIIKPFIETTEVFETIDEAKYAFSEAKKQLGNVSKEALNVVFETHCPGKSIPILWQKTKTYKPLFYNDDATNSLLRNQENSEDLRTRLFHANTELSQELNKFIVRYLNNKAAKEGHSDWMRVEYIPNKILSEISNRWIEEGQKMSPESYMGFIHYKEIIKKNKDLMQLFQIGNEGLAYFERLNVLRRDPAHPEKPAPPVEDVSYFEDTAAEILKRIKKFNKRIELDVA